MSTRPPAPPPGDDDRAWIVPFVAFRCPRCNADKPRTYGRRGRVRFHRCQDCNTKYRSLELTIAEMVRWTPPPS